MSNILQIIDNKMCSGCCLCELVCPNGAISISLSDEGFLRPKINDAYCKKCGKCVDNCVKSKKIKGNLTEFFYSYQTLNKNNLLISTSGGFFQEIAKICFLNNYSIFGTVFNCDMQLVHIKAKTIDDIKKMSGSKYVQSSPILAYKEVFKELSLGKKVLFSGTPCQIAALKTYLEFYKCNSNFLYTLDFPCYGVPSIKFFNETVLYFEKKYNSKLVDFRFRDKEKNGFSHTTVLCFEKNKVIRKITISDFKKIPYHNAFAQRNFFQSNCYKCEFTKKERISDITMGSFWNFNLIKDKYDISKGVSLICINSHKGKDLFDLASSTSIYAEHKYWDVYPYNEGLIKAANKSNRDEVVNYYVMKGYKKTVNKYYPTSVFYKTLKIISKIRKKLLGGKK